MNKTKFLFIMLIIICFLIACSNSEQMKKLNAYIGKLKQTVISNKEKQPIEIPLPKPATYQATATREPFAEKNASDDAKNAAEPLQAFPLSMLRFVGTLTENNHISAIILTPDNKIYPVMVGDNIGDHHGKIIKIELDRLEVMELESEEGNRATQKIVTLQLKEES